MAFASVGTILPKKESRPVAWVAFLFLSTNITSRNALCLCHFSTPTDISWRKTLSLTRLSLVKRDVLVSAALKFMQDSYACGIFLQHFSACCAVVPCFLKTRPSNFAMHRENLAWLYRIRCRRQKPI